jgi:hypothetical protein
MFDLSFAFNLFTGLFSEVSLLLGGLSVGLWSTLGTLVHLAGWAVLGLLVLLRWRRPPRLGLEFPLVLATTASLLYSSYAGNALGNRAFQSETTSTALQLSQALQALGIFLMPFLLIAGADAADFGMIVTQQVTSRLQRSQGSRGPWRRRLLAGALALFLLVRLAGQWLLPSVRNGDSPWRWGAVLVVLGLLAILALRRRASPPGPLPAWVVPAAALLLTAGLFLIQLLTYAEVAVAVSIVILGGSGAAILEAVDRIFGALVRWNELGVALAALLGAALLTAWGRGRGRGGRAAAALYAAIFGVWLVYWVLTRSGETLGALNYSYTNLSAVTTPVLLLWLGGLSITRRLSWRALLHLTAAALLFWVLEFQGWLSDPLSPLYGLFGAEAIFLTASIFLNVMAAGNRFSLNTEAAGFPRTSRGLLYFGYALLTVTNLTWLAAAHNVAAMSTNELIAQNGFVVTGLPLAFWALLTASPALLGEPTANSINS